MRTSTYKKAVRVMAHNLKPVKLDAFTASTLLAKIYSKPKETTLKDILKVRETMVR